MPLVNGNVLSWLSELSMVLTIAGLGWVRKRLEVRRRGSQLLLLHHSSRPIKEEPHGCCFLSQWRQRSLELVQIILDNPETKLKGSYLQLEYGRKPRAWWGGIQLIRRLWLLRLGIKMKVYVVVKNRGIFYRDTAKISAADRVSGSLVKYWADMSMLLALSENKNQLMVFLRRPLGMVSSHRAQSRQHSQGVDIVIIQEPLT